MNVPCSAISFDAFMKPVHAVRASAPPTLMRRTPRSPATFSDGPAAPTRRLTGFGCTAFTTAEISSAVAMPGA